MSLEEQLKEINDMGITICNKTYKFKSFSPNKFAEYVSKNSNLIYSKGDFYNYKNGKWTKVEELTVLQKIRNLLHKYYKDIWSTKREKEYIEALKRIIHYDGEFNNNKRYIRTIWNRLVLCCPGKLWDGLSTGETAGRYGTFSKMQ